MLQVISLLPNLLPFVMCLRTPVTTIKHHYPKQLGEQRVYLDLKLSGHVLSLREVRMGTWSQELKQR